jgi:hypothetical protein
MRSSSIRRLRSGLNAWRECSFPATRDPQAIRVWASMCSVGSIAASRGAIYKVRNTKDTEEKRILSR